MESSEFQDEIKSNYTDVTSSPSEYLFGHTVIRFAKDEDILFGLLGTDKNVTTHAATYLGTSRDGTQYTWSKNGAESPGIFTVEQLKSVEEYGGKIQGFGTENGGGYYNRTRK